MTIDENVTGHSARFVFVDFERVDALQEPLGPLDIQLIDLLMKGHLDIQRSVLDVGADRKDPLCRSRTIA